MNHQRPSSRGLLSVVLFAGIALAPASASAPLEGWKKMRVAEERQEVSTWRRPVDGNPLDAFQGRMEVPHTLSTVLAVLGDIDAFPEWVFQCDQTQMRPEEWGSDVVRIVIEGIWPVSDRDAIARSTFEQDPETEAITIRSRDDEGIMDEQSGFVRIPALDNTFQLEPLDDGWTRITFRTFVDPGGRIPKWLANFVATRAPLVTLRGMRERMELDKYQDVGIDHFPVMLPGMDDMTIPEGH